MALIGVFQDVTEQQELVQSVAEDRERYRLLAENANDIISTTSMDSTVLFVTPAVERVLGYAPEEVIGRRTIEFTHPDDVDAVVARFTALVSAGPTAVVEPYSFVAAIETGLGFGWKDNRACRSTRAGVRSCSKTWCATSTFGSAQSRLRWPPRRRPRPRAAAMDSERRYRLLAENAIDVIGRYALDGTILYVSPACEEVLGFTPEEMLGRRTTDLIHGDDLARVRAQFAAAFYTPDGPTSMSTEHRVARKDGRVVWLEGRPRLVRDGEGRPLEYHDVMRDITARKILEAELEEARGAAEAAAQAKADFLANMSHELRTPLTSILDVPSRSVGGSA